MKFGFEVEAGDGQARAGTIRTAHGIARTPLFLPVATKGTVKTLDWPDVRALGAQAVICNAFLLGLHPGEEVLRRLGGAHGFTGWDGPVFADSGGFQVLRDGLLVGVGDEGIRFKNPYTGQRLVFTPEACAAVQAAVAPDVAMLLDDCPPHDAAPKRLAQAVGRTVDWAARFRAANPRPDGATFAITQGGCDPGLRRRCTEALLELDFDGYGVGGLCIGEPREAMLATLRTHLPGLPRDRPRYLMGVGSPLELLEAVGLGVDAFDSAFPTRNARHQYAYTRSGHLDLGAPRFHDDPLPVEDECRCPTCSAHSRAYLHHLLREHELSGLRLVTLHNLHFTLTLLRDARTAIVEGEFKRFRTELERGYRPGAH